MKTLKFSKQKFESKIETDFEDRSVYTFLETDKITDTFKLFFEETIHGNTYQFTLYYTPDFEQVYYLDEIICTCGNKYVELHLNACNYNPAKPTLYETLQLIIEKQKQRDQENNDRLEKEAKYIEETNQILNLKNR